jgi:hypothetical protein
MTLETLLVYGLAALVGWLLRHFGIGSGFKVPGLSNSVPPPLTPSTPVPILATLRADIDQIVKVAVEAAVKQALDDIKGAAVSTGAGKS